jgi:hypothetical protein
MASEGDRAAARRRMAARVGGLALHSKYDSRALTEPARKGFRDRFLDEVDPDMKLSASERERRADLALRSHMAKLAIKSSRARQKKKQP